jgi:hypothetical protein
MTIIHDRDGHELADIAVSERQLGVLDLGEEVVVIYHTPQMLRYVLGEHTGSFMLKKVGPLIVAADADGLQRYADLQRAIKKTRERV